MGVLKQGAAATIKVGPFVDADDGATPETGLTIPRGDVLLSKNGGALTQKAETSAATHDAGGWYNVALNAADTGTAGVLTVSIQAAGALPFFAAFTVLEADAYDMLFVDGPETGADVAGDVRAELATELARIDADVSSRSTLTAANVRTAVGLASANLDTQLGAVPTTTQLNARTLPTAQYATASAVSALPDADTIAAAVRVNFATELARIDADVSSRSTAADVAGFADDIVGALTRASRSGNTLTVARPSGGNFTRTITTDPNAEPIVSSSGA